MWPIRLRILTGRSLLCPWFSTRYPDENEKERPAHLAETASAMRRALLLGIPNAALKRGADVRGGIKYTGGIRWTEGMLKAGESKSPRRRALWAVYEAEVGGDPYWAKGAFKLQIPVGATP